PHDGIAGQYRPAVTAARPTGRHLAAAVARLALAVPGFRRRRGADLAAAVPADAGNPGRGAPRRLAPGVHADPAAALAVRLWPIAGQPPLRCRQRGPGPGGPAADRLDRPVAGAADPRRGAEHDGIRAVAVAGIRRADPWQPDHQPHRRPLPAAQPGAWGPVALPGGL